MISCFQKKKSSIPTLFYDMASQPSNAVFWWSKCAGIDLKVKLILLGKGEHMTPEYLSINPRHQVPALQQGNVVITEAQAIMYYLAEQYQCQDKWFGSNSQEKSQVQMLLSWYHTNLRQKLTTEFFFTQKFMPCFMGTPKPDNEALQKALDDRKEVFQHLNSFLANKNYFIGNKLTVVDFLYAEEIFALHGDDLFVKMLGNYSNITNWLKNMQKVPHYKEINYTYDNYIIPTLKEFANSGQTGNFAEISIQEEQRLKKLSNFL